MSFSSVLQLLTNAHILREEFGAFLGDVLGLRALWTLIDKLRNLLLKVYRFVVYGKNRGDLESIYAKSSSGGSGGMNWTGVLFVSLFGFWILRRLVQRLKERSSRLHQSHIGQPARTGMMNQFSDVPFESFGPRNFQNHSDWSRQWHTG